MNSRVFGLRNSFIKLIAPMVGPKKKYATKPAHCDAHMNELPVPCGPWDEWYKGRQSWYNMNLALGAIWFVVSLSALIYTESMFFNWSPPCTPGPPTEASGGEDECEEL